MIFRLLSFYHPKLPTYLVYMLQQVEYEPNKFLSWIITMPRLTRIMYRQSLVVTSKSKALVLSNYFFWLAFILYGAWASTINLLSGILLIALSPLLTILFFYLAVSFAWALIEQPNRTKLIDRSRQIFKSHPGLKLAIIGSYGKTTMKELLLSAFGESKKIVATPGNKNVPISHANWARKLTGKEEVLIIEYGEGAPGDIAKFAGQSAPSAAIITGLAPNHLDKYHTLGAVAEDLLSISKFVDKDQIFVNYDDHDLAKWSNKQFIGYDKNSVLGWKITNIVTSIDGLSFRMQKSSKTMLISSGLIGQHQVGPLALSAAIAFQHGVKPKSIEKNLKSSKPFDHRMQPRQIAGGWIIDDTYNGNLEGIRVGLELITGLKAKRKFYVTPGLVDQGSETERVHREIGELIAKTKLDKVYLINNSASKIIEQSLKLANPNQVIEIVDDPLDFYNNINQFVAAGDIWLMQNDWTDNYR